MAIKKMTELTQVTFLNDTDLLLVETPDGTRAVAKNAIISNDEREKIASTGFIAQPEPPENKTILWLDTDDDTNDTLASGGLTNVTLFASNWESNDGNYTQVVSEIQDSVFADKTSIDCLVDLNTRQTLINNNVKEIGIMNQDGIPIAYLIGNVLNQDITIQVRLITF